MREDCESNGAGCTESVSRLSPLRGQYGPLDPLPSPGFSPTGQYAGSTERFSCAEAFLAVEVRYFRRWLMPSRFAPASLDWGCLARGASALVRPSRRSVSWCVTVL